MPKRKRDEIHRGSSASSPEVSGNHALKRQKKLSAQRISAAHKPLVAALRLAAGFERQKFSRRKKTAQQKNDAKAVARLDVEYAKLKKMDLNKLAEQHLRKVISKVKSLRDSDVLPDDAKNIEKGEQDPAMLNVQARLYKVDAVKRVVDETIDDLKAIIEEVPSEDVVPSQKASSEDDVGEMFAAFDARIAAPSSGDEDSEDSLSYGLRPPSVEESESDGNYELNESLQSENEGSSLRLSVGDNVDASRDSITDPESDSDEASIPVPKSKGKSRKLEAQAGVYIPSLSHAAYLSGSESEASDLDAQLQPRKNRRGQRARQKIWEKKFGDKAQHMKKKQEERSQGWDAKRGAVGDRKRGQGDRSMGRRGPERTGENAVPLGIQKTKRDDTGPLHPSWIAAKAAKEKKLVAKPEGKRIVFD